MGNELILFNVGSLQALSFPRAQQRVKCIVAIREFEDQLPEVGSQLGELQAAVEPLRRSVGFREFLRTVLAIGNYLNGSTARGAAYGFKWDGTLAVPVWWRKGVGE